MANWLQENHLVPDKVVTSDSVRTLQTAELMIREWDRNVELEERHDLYHASANTLVSVTQGLNDQLETVLLLAHNPGMEELFAECTGNWEKFPTAAIACFRMNLESWMEYHPRCESELLEFCKPKEIG